MTATNTDIKSVGTKLIPFLKTIAIYFVVFMPFGQPSVTSATLKALPIVSLILFTYLHGRTVKKEHKWFVNKIMTGLIFSCIGDVSLVWKQYFALGMLAFGIGHVHYIMALGMKPFNWKVAVPLFLFSGGSVIYMMPGLKGVLIPGVPIYSILLTTMSWRAFARLKTGFSYSKLFAALGALSFCASDAILGLDTFRFSVPHNQVLIMTTYYAAQLGIALSVLDPRVPGNKIKAK